MSDLKDLARKLRNGGNTYQDYRMFLFTPEEVKEYADLLDPSPRFNEQQMAFWRGWRSAGATRALWSSGHEITCMMFMCEDIPVGSLTVREGFLGLDKNGFADLAVLLGKEDAACHT